MHASLLNQQPCFQMYFLLRQELWVTILMNMTFTSELVPSQALVMCTSCCAYCVPDEMWVGNEQDFYNLVDVYLDAVFYPRCVNDVSTFQQEGWHYELNDPSEDITFKGKLLRRSLFYNHLLGAWFQDIIVSFKFEFSLMAIHWTSLLNFFSCYRGV
jgi:hypothetical protein